MNLGQEYYLVNFSCGEYQYVALMDDMWLIYDHYLFIKEWSTVFYVTDDEIEEVAV